MPPNIKPEEEAAVAYWAGCQESYFYTNLSASTVRIFKETGEKFTYLGADEWCCGFPYVICGLEDDLKESVLHNIQEMNKRNVKTVVTHCAGCFMMWSNIYPEMARKIGIDFPFEVKHITQYAVNMIRGGKLTPRIPIDLTVTYHDPCHLGRHCGVYREPREILKAIPSLTLIEMVNSKQNSTCCGGMSAAFQTFPEISVNIWKDKMADVTATGASAVATACPGCLFNLDIAAKTGGHHVKVVDVIDLLLESLGFEIEMMPKVKPKLSITEQMVEHAKHRALAILNPLETKS